jgi:hypothetical protein
LMSVSTSRPGQYAGAPAPRVVCAEAVCHFPPACLNSPSCRPRQSAAHRIGRHAGRQCVVLRPKTSVPIRGPFRSISPYGHHTSRSVGIPQRFHLTKGDLGVRWLATAFVLANSGCLRKQMAGRGNLRGAAKAAASRRTPRSRCLASRRDRSSGNSEHGKHRAMKPLAQPVQVMLQHIAREMLC